MLVVLSLFGVFSSLALQIFTPCLSIMRTDQSQACLDQTALVLSLKMERELLATSRDSLTVCGSELSFLSAQSYDPMSGLPIWQNFVIYYRQGGVLYRKTYVAAGLPSTKTMQLKGAQLDFQSATPNGSEAKMAQNVQSFTPTLGSNVTIAVRLQEASVNSSLSLVARPRL